MYFCYNYETFGVLNLSQQQATPVKHNLMFYTIYSLSIYYVVGADWTCNPVECIEPGSYHNGHIYWSLFKITGQVTRGDYTLQWGAYGSRLVTIRDPLGINKGFLRQRLHKKEEIRFGEKMAKVCQQTVFDFFGWGSFQD